MIPGKRHIVPVQVIYIIHINQIALMTSAERISRNLAGNLVQSARAGLYITVPAVNGKRMRPAAHKQNPVIGNGSHLAAPAEMQRKFFIFGNMTSHPFQKPAKRFRFHRFQKILNRIQIIGLAVKRIAGRYEADGSVLIHQSDLLCQADTIHGIQINVQQIQII